MTLTKYEIMEIWDQANEIEQDMDCDNDSITEMIQMIQQRARLIMKITSKEFTTEEYQEMLSK